MFVSGVGIYQSSGGLKKLKWRTSASNLFTNNYLNHYFYEKSINGMTSLIF